MRKINQSSRLEKIKRICLLALMLALTTIFCFVPVQFGTITLALMILPTLIVACCCDFKSSAIMGLAMGLINYIAWFTTKAASPVAPIFQNPIVCIVPRVLIAVVCYFTRFGLQKTALLLRMKRACNYEYMRDCANENSCKFSTEKADENLQESTPFSNDFADNDVESANTISKSQEGKKRAKEILTDQFIYAFSAALGVVTNTLFVAIFTLLFFNGTSIAQNTVVTVEYVLAWFGVNFAVEVVSFSLITPPIVLALKAAKLAK